VNCVDLRLEVVTPAFLAGADQHHVELRSASLKGLLRWWWRASEGHRFPTAAALAEAEAGIFGSAELKLKSPLQVGVELLSSQMVIPRGKDAPTSSAQYSYGRKDREGSVHTGKAQALHYLGYGPMRLASKEEREAAEAGRDPALLGADRRAKRGVLYIRPAFAPGSVFKVRLAWRDGSLSDDQGDQLLRACGAWLALGGVGCRSRKGFGSLHLINAAVASVSQRAEQVTMKIRDAIKSYMEEGEQLRGALPQWPQLRFRRVLHWTELKPSWEEALGALALEYRKLRPRRKDHERRFICGEANPRRASSVLLSVHRRESKFVGLMVALPCRKDEESEGRSAWDSFLHSRT